MSNLNHMKKNAKQFQKIYSDLKLPKNCPGIKWRRGDTDGDFDEEMLPLLRKLNELEFCHTTGSCAGHNLRDIKNHGKGWYIESPYRMAINLHVKTTHLNKFSKIASDFFNVSRGSFWCEFGYHDDYNNRTENGYIPLVITVFCKTKKRRDRLLANYVDILS